MSPSLPKLLPLDAGHDRPIVCAPEIFALPSARAQANHALNHSLGRESVGSAKILLEVSAENEAALALYSDLRFEMVGRRKAYYSDGTDAILMTKYLGPHLMVT